MTSYKLTAVGDGAAKFEPFRDSSVSIPSNQLQVDTSFPRMFEFNLMAQTMYKTIWQQFRVRICGDESIRLLEDEPYLIDLYKKSTRLVLEKYDYERFFSVTIPECEIVSYLLA